ncbi:MAG TPA: hypothetical protein VHZ49_15725 [Methylomirabilota bacterium]|jgi:hypothetical protein|nr:hypothetical protein [Methylomirabilota bacterium]
MKAFFWGLVVVACCYAAYAGMMSVYQWFQIRTVVEEVLEPRSLADLPTAGDVKKRILREATTAGVPLDDREVNVVATTAGLAIQVAWTFPVIVYKGESVLAVPLSVKKQHPAGGRAYLPREPAFASAISFSTR